MVTLSGLAGCALVFLLIIKPGNPFTRMFRRPISNAGEKVVIGPYPLQEDFTILKANKVALIVSLLNPKIPYENILLQQEKELAQSFGIRLVVYPMSSILGKRFGSEYDRNAEAAAEEVLAEPQNVYIHCYLGVHRVQVVKNLIEEKGKKVGQYAIRQGDRSDEANLLDKAQLEYNAGRYASAIAILEKCETLTPTARMLFGWAKYHTGEIAAAQKCFESELYNQDLANDAKSGIGYCMLRQNRIEFAVKKFSEVLANRPDDLMALEGMGIALNRRNEPENALVYLRKAQRIDPQNREISELILGIEK